MHELRRPSVSTLAALALLLTASLAAAAPDHLICRRTREPGPGTIRSADVVSAAYAGTGCVVRTPAKIFCEEATTSNFSPALTNPFHGRGNAGRFLCYRLKCPKELDTIQLTDPLGAHLTTAGASQLLCVPEVASGLTSCDTPGGTCLSCAGGCVTHQDPAPPPGVCIDPNACYHLELPCSADSQCAAGYACVVDPHNPTDNSCCPACAP